MMLKDLATIQQAEENMSNLTSASGDQTSVSSHPLPPPSKKKRSLPGNPDPEAEVIALSPRALMATNRYVCEICGKGFQRDQNLQLHRRGHNLPWKLKQRNPNEAVRKKVYVCPEPGCVHHDPARALGDLTGIKKHFSRKHGEKRWRCDRCGKKYAVQSDWKAHSKVCGTREYRCDCGTLFSRRDSFITHRAFCDALAEESARATGEGQQQLQVQGMLFSHAGGDEAGFQMPVLDPAAQQQQHLQGSQLIHELCLKRENHHHQQQQQQQQQFAPSSWLSEQQQIEMAGGEQGASSPAMFVNGTPAAESSSTQQQPGPGSGGTSSFAFSSPAPAHMSATALLQKAAQMGATLSRPSCQGQMAAATLSTNAPVLEAVATTSNNANNLTGTATAIGAGFGVQLPRTNRAAGGNDGLTRDFLGLRAFSHGDMLGMAGFDPCGMPTSASASASAAVVYDQQGGGHHQSGSKPWHG